MLIESQITNTISDKFTKEIKTGINISDSIKNVISQSIKDSIQTVNSTEKTVTQQMTIKKTIEHSIPENTGSPIYCVKVYTKKKIHVCFDYIDYLFIEYKRSLLGVRKKRSKRPLVEDGRHQNKINIGRHILTCEYWQLVRDQFWMVKDQEYKRTVHNTEDITVESGSLNSERIRTCNAPTLYKIANAAFPIKWSKRRGSWTEEELHRIEENGGYEEVGYF